MVDGIGARMAPPVIVQRTMPVGTLLRIPRPPVVDPQPPTARMEYVSDDEDVNTDPYQLGLFHGLGAVD
eukprot:5596857-Amphidinium_carterae.1